MKSLILLMGVLASADTLIYEEQSDGSLYTDGGYYMTDSNGGYYGPEGEHYWTLDAQHRDSSRTDDDNPRNPYLSPDFKHYRY